MAIAFKDQLKEIKEEIISLKKNVSDQIQEMKNLFLTKIEKNTGDIIADSTRLQQSFSHTMPIGRQPMFSAFTQMISNIANENKTITYNSNVITNNPPAVDE